jgi:hypothetical protein
VITPILNQSSADSPLALPWWKCDVAERKGILFKGETKCKRIAIPMFMGEVG